MENDKLICMGSGSKGNAYAIVTDKEILLLDCGINFRDIQRGIQYRTTDVTGCLVTHRHSDHVKAIKDIYMRGIPVYGNKETADWACTRSKALITTLKALRRINVGHFSVTPFLVPHTTSNDEGELIDCQNFGYLIKWGDKSLLYATDFEYIKYKFADQNINYFLIECNHLSDALDTNAANFDHVVKGHASLKTTCDFLRVNATEQTKGIILCHLSPYNSDKNRMIMSAYEAAGGGNKLVTIADKGVTIDL